VRNFDLSIFIIKYEYLLISVAKCQILKEIIDIVVLLIILYTKFVRKGSLARLTRHCISLRTNHCDPELTPWVEAELDTRPSWSLCSYSRESFDAYIRTERLLSQETFVAILILFFAPRHSRRIYGPIVFKNLHNGSLTCLCTHAGVSILPANPRTPFEPPPCVRRACPLNANARAGTLAEDEI